VVAGASVAGVVGSPASLAAAPLSEILAPAPAPLSAPLPPASVVPSVASAEAPFPESTGASVPSGAGLPSLPGMPLAPPPGSWPAFGSPLLPPFSTFVNFVVFFPFLCRLFILGN